MAQHLHMIDKIWYRRLDKPECDGRIETHNRK